MADEIKGISFPFRIGGRGGVVMSGRSATGQQHLKENIIAIVGTQELERVHNPEFGLESLDIFFTDLNESTATMAKYKIIEKINQFEDRVNILDVIINEVDLPDGEVSYTVDILFEEVDSGITNTASVTI
jgi:phage baseplate assembly protein W